VATSLSSAFGDSFSKFLFCLLWHCQQEEREQAAETESSEKKRPAAEAEQLLRQVPTKHPAI